MRSRVRRPLAWWRFRRSSRELIDVAKHGRAGLIIAVLLVGLPLLLNQVFWDGPRQLNSSSIDAPVTILATVVTFFTVALLGVSVSLTLLSTSAEKSGSDLMAVLVNDEVRDFLLQTIFASFLVSLANLYLLTKSFIQPHVALIAPAALAVLTLLLMVGYIVERVRLFDELGMVKYLARRANARTGMLARLGSGHARLTVETKIAIGQDLIRIAYLFGDLVSSDRLLDASRALKVGMGSLEELIAREADSAVVQPTPAEIRAVIAETSGEAGPLADSLVRALAPATRMGHDEDEVVESWRLAELAAIAVFQEGVQKGYRAGDDRMMATWLGWLHDVGVQRLLPATAQSPEGRPGTLDGEWGRTYLTLQRCLVGVVAASTPPGERAVAGNRNRFKLDSVAIELGHLCGELAATGGDTALALAFTDSAIRVLKAYIDGIGWQRNVPPFIRPDLLERVMLDRAQGIDDVTWYSARLDRSTDTPEPDIAGSGSNRDLTTQRAQAQFTSMTHERRTRVRRCVGTPYQSLLDDLEHDVWAPPQGGKQVQDAYNRLVDEHNRLVDESGEGVRQDRMSEFPEPAALPPPQSISYVAEVISYVGSRNGGR